MLTKNPKRKRIGSVKYVAPVKKQTLGTVPFIIFLALVSSTGPIATDLYLPALPDMAALLDAPVAAINFTITAYFLTQAIGMLLFGPFSDRYGRKRPMMIGLALFLFGALICAFAPNVWVIIVGRILAGLGGGGLCSLATALVKDCFEGKSRQNALVAIQAAVSIAPMVAPVLGAALLTITDWRGTFIAQAAIGLCALPLLLKTKESLPAEERTTGNPLTVFNGMGSVLRTRNMALLLVGTSVPAMSLLAYVTTASYVYIDFFGMSTFMYSLFFALNSASGIAGTLLVAVVLKHTTPRKLLTVGFVGFLITCAVFLLVGELSPILFLIGVSLMGVCVVSLRPIVANTILELRDGDTGAVASLINFTFSMAGCLGSALISLPWSTYIFGIAIISLFSAVISLGAWMIFIKRTRN